MICTSYINAYVIDQSEGFVEAINRNCLSHWCDLGNKSNMANSTGHYNLDEVIGFFQDENIDLSGELLN